MTDVVDKTTRSRMMAGISAKDTEPERVLRRALHKRGYRYRLHVRGLPGTPDLVFHRFKAVCFVNGCFWHRHKGCSYTTTPATRTNFWLDKFEKTIERDHRTKNQLLEGGWRVAIVWECALRRNSIKETIDKLDEWLHSSAKEYETTV